MNKILRVTTTVLAYSVLYLALISCGSGGGGGGGGSSSSNPAGGNVGGGTAPTISQGNFIDSAVQGLRYVSGGQSGFTDAQGMFNYEEGSNVRFFVGDIMLGEAPGSALMTPFEIVQTATVTDQRVINICRFLITLDDDSDPGNGIIITPAINSAAMNQTADFTNTSDVQTVIAILSGRTLVSAQAAINHFIDTLIQRKHPLALQPYAGSYSGTFSGDQSGSWHAVLDSAGNLSVTVNNGSPRVLFILDFASFTVQNNGDINSFWDDPPNTYSVTVTLSGAVTGNWRGTGTLNTLSGTKQ